VSGFRFFGGGIAKGMVLTLKHLFRRPITTQYPEERLTISRRARGYELIWNEKRCTGCATCAKSCPQGAIKIKTSLEQGDRYIVEQFELDSGYCIFCGLCVEACPYDALYLSYEYEMARYRRRELVKDKEALLITPSKRLSGYYQPEIEKTLPRQTLLLDREKEE